jgi:hypothetical protein
MPIPAHLGDAARATAAGRQAVEKLNAALEILASLRRAGDFQPPYEIRTGEDARALRYGRDTIELMSLLVEYHEALRQDRADQASALWRRIEQVALSMDSYWVPIGFAGKGKAGIESRDGLTRSQLRSLVRQCRNYRVQNKLPVNE